MMRILWTGAAALALAVSGAMPAAAEELRGEVAKQMPSLMAIYKDLHAHPELSFMQVLLGYSALDRSEEHTSELQSLMRISYAVFCLNKKKKSHELANNIQTNREKTN